MGEGNYEYSDVGKKSDRTDIFIPFCFYKNRKFLYKLASLKEKTVAFGVQGYQLSELC